MLYCGYRPISDAMVAEPTPGYDKYFAPSRSFPEKLDGNFLLSENEQQLLKRGFWIPFGEQVSQPVPGIFGVTTFAI